MGDFNGSPWARHLLALFFSVIFIFGSISLTWFYINHYSERRLHDDHYRIVGLALKTEKEVEAPMLFFQEVLGLSLNKPLNIFAFSPKNATDLLLSHPLIKEVKVDRIKPGIVFIDYELREPIALLGNFDHAAIDESGVIFPLYSFYPERSYPKLYIEEDSRLSWGDAISSTDLLLFQEVVNDISSFDGVVVSLDLSRKDIPSLGQREIVVSLEEKGGRQRKMTIRLNDEHYKKGLYQLSYLLKSWQEEGQFLVDQRIDDMALVKKVGEGGGRVN